MADTESLVNSLNECAEKGDFEGAFRLVRENKEELGKKLQATGVRDALKKTTKDRLLLSFLDGVEFGARPLDESLVRLEKLVYLVSKKPGDAGALVLSKAWGLGKVKSVDDFYKRVTVDFRTKRGHQFAYAAACDMLEPAPDGHILVKREVDPAGFEKLLKENPGDFIVEVIKSFGDMPIVRLEDVCVQNGFVKSVNWKKFWDAARAELRKNKLVEIPAKRAEPIRVRAAVEDYGDGWMTAFAHETDPKSILASVREYVAQGKFKAADDATKSKISERLSFAVTAARKVDDALYARLACLVRELGFQTPPAAEMREYLWERRRYIKAAVELPSREVGAMIAFLADSEEAKAKLYAAIPEFCYAAVYEVFTRFGAEAACRKAIGDFMKDAQPPATLTTLVVGKIEQFGKFEYADVDVDGKKIRVLKKYELMGLDIERGDMQCTVSRTSPLRPVDIQTLPFPGFPTDMQAQTMCALALAQGSCIVTENVNTEVPFFQDNFKQTVRSKFKEYDRASDLDLEQIQSGQPIVLYVPENCQGSISNPIADKWYNVQGFLGSKVANCTYVDMAVKIVDAEGCWKNYNAAMYLGSD